MKKYIEDILKTKFTFPINTFKELSCDTKHAKYLTDSNITAIDFDKLKESFCKSRNISKYLSSNDALYISEEQSYFIEFKNGQIVDSIDGTHATVAELKEKIDQSFMILFSPDCIGLKEVIPDFYNDLSFALKNISYILVYNDKNNRKPTKADKESWKKQIRSGEFEKELEYFKSNFKIILRTKEIKKYEKMDFNQFIDKQIQEEKFITLLTDIRQAMNKKNFGAFEELVDMLSQEADLPIMRFGLEEFENKLFNKVYTYTGDTFDEEGAVLNRGQFHKFFIEKYLMEEKRCEGE